MSDEHFRTYDPLVCEFLDVFNSGLSFINGVARKAKSLQVNGESLNTNKINENRT